MKKALKVILLFSALIICFSSISVFGTESQELTNGSKGAAVTELQERLKDLGYYTISVDGVYGNGTSSAVSAFQGRNGLTQDGVASKETLEKIFSEDAVSAPPKPDIEIISVKKNGNYSTRTYKNNLDEPVDYIEYYIIPFDVNGNVTSLSEFGDNDILCASLYDNFTLEAGATVTYEYDDSYYGTEHYSSIAVGVFSYHTISGKTITLAPEQVTFKKSDGSTIYPIAEETEPRTISSDDYERARTVKFGYVCISIRYYATSYYMFPQGHYVESVDPNGMAEQAGLQAGDVIMSFDGDNADSPYAAEYAKLKILDGGTVEVKYWRANKEYTTYFSLDMDEPIAQENDKSEDTSFSVADELLKLSDLLDKGVITQEEFDAQKDKLLNN